jgi:hypothetical protein
MRSQIQADPIGRHRPATGVCRCGRVGCDHDDPQPAAGQRVKVVVDSGIAAASESRDLSVTNV